MEKFAIGLVIGGLGGALLATNNLKMRTLIKKGQDEIKTRLDELMEAKIKEMENAEPFETMKETGETVKETATAVKERAKESVEAVKGEAKDFANDVKSAVKSRKKATK